MNSKWVGVFTLAGTLLALGISPAWAATPGSEEGVFTTTTSRHTTTTINDTMVRVNNYVTNVIGLASWTGPDADTPFTDREVYRASFLSPVGSQEVSRAYDEASARITSVLDSTGGRGQIQISSSTSTSSSSDSRTVEDSRSSRDEIQPGVITFGPATLLVGDLDAGGTPFVLGLNDTNVNIHTETYLTINTTTTTTTNTNTDYIVSGELYSSPIVLDLSGTGKLAASDGHWLPHPKAFYKTHRVMFDFFGNGFPVAMEWVGETDGLLVRPKADGKVDGTCLFGNATGYANGYEQMAILDVNLDGHVSGKELAGLSVWQDKNGDGKCDAGELQTVQQMGITDFNLKHSQFKSSYTMKGKTQAMYDWWPTMFEIKKNKQPV